jgi:hypothetical protein
MAPNLGHSIVAISGYVEIPAGVLDAPNAKPGAVRIDPYVFEIKVRLDKQTAQDAYRL